MTTDNLFLFAKQTKTGGQQYSDTVPFSIPWFVGTKHSNLFVLSIGDEDKKSFATFVLGTKMFAPIHRRELLSNGILSSHF
jgi:hypothetical protein